MREQFEDDLRALTEAEQDSKQLKSASGICSSTASSRPSSCRSRSGRPPSTASFVKAVTRQFVKKASEAIYKDSSAGRSRWRSAVRTAAARRRSARSSARCASLRALHGSALFTRGQTQIMSLLTLGTAKEGQRIDDLSLEQERRYMHHYNFPPYSVGETSFMRGPKRRDIGHGALAQRALEPMIPPADEFRTRSASSRRRSSRMAVVDGLRLRDRRSR